MDDTDGQGELDDLRTALESARSRVIALEARLAEAESGHASINGDEFSTKIYQPIDQPSSSKTHLLEVGEDVKWPLHPEEYTRYGRQMIMPEIGLEGSPACVQRVVSGSRSDQAS